MTDGAGRVGPWAAGGCDRGLVGRGDRAGEGGGADGEAGGHTHGDRDLHGAGAVAGLFHEPIVNGVPENTLGAALCPA
jgi:hypothetical protein